MNKPTDLRLEQITPSNVLGQTSVLETRGNSKTCQPWQKVGYTFTIFTFLGCVKVCCGGCVRCVRGGGVAFLVIVLKNWEDSSTNLFATTLPLLSAQRLATPFVCVPSCALALPKSLDAFSPHMRVPTSQGATAVGQDQDIISQEFISDEMGSVSTQDFSGEVEKSKRLLVLTLASFTLEHIQLGAGPNGARRW